ncbi:PstA family ABC transporter permease [Novipirellula artificiosorum]|uniref:Phosphate transport system permease protein PstA n=1 Tax=Novipirellula artificiosorum TaxID=2528016 RepID=A0A5C6E6D9_9BACT|nr:PstA family ABC transporter permease [Novipirellula artificiosorum]TWU42739.1 Phosphate transport system permease protein PstA [Novipirellula artificiosorum]
MSRSPTTNEEDIEARLKNAEPASNRSRMQKDRAFRWLCIAIATVSVLVLVALLTSIVVQGVPVISWTLLSGTPEPEPSEAGMFPALMGTIWICSLCALITLPIGVATAVLLEEFKPRTKVAAWSYSLIQLNISNLAGVPSVVYGILGLTAFVSMFSLFGNATQPGAAVWEWGATYYDQFSNLGSDPFLMMSDEVDERYFLVPVENRTNPPTVPTEGMMAYENSVAGLVPVEVHVADAMGDLPTDPEVLATSIDSAAVPGRISEKAWYYFQLPLGRGVLAGALTLMLVILPVIIISTQEALRAVPSSLRDGALGIGATPWQVVWNVTLPSAIPGIMTGSILAMSRAIGETAPILIIAGIVYIRTSPQHLMDSYTVMPLQIYNWTSRPQDEFHSLAAGGIVILLGILLSFNAVAVLIRHRMQKPLS